MTRQEREALKRMLQKMDQDADPGQWHTILGMRSCQAKQSPEFGESEDLLRLLDAVTTWCCAGNQKALSALEKSLSSSGVKVTEQMKQDLMNWKNTTH